MRVRITAVIAEEFGEGRQLAEQPFSRLTAPGTYEITEAEATELLDDAQFYCDPDGPGMSLTIGQRSAYRALAQQLLNNNNSEKEENQ